MCIILGGMIMIYIEIGYGYVVIFDLLSVGIEVVI